MREREGGGDLNVCIFEPPLEATLFMGRDEWEGKGERE